MFHLLNTNVIICAMCLKLHCYSLYTEQKMKRNNRPPKIFEFNGKTLIISGFCCMIPIHGILGYTMQKTDFYLIKMNGNFLSSKIMQIGKDVLCASAHF